MIQKRTRFPLVGDDEPIVSELPQMNLYEESDLISNIKGPYQDREDFFFDKRDPEATRTYREEAQVPPTAPSFDGFSRKERLQKPSRLSSSFVTSPLKKTQGQLAREQAREDLKQKRSAAYLKDERPIPARILKQPEPAPLEVSDLSVAAARLKQENYILADVPMTYPLDKKGREKEPGVKKNSYDFLKTSQVYNYPERKIQTERKMAQELNLTYIEEE